MPCPFCDEPISVNENVCRRCDHYVNQVSAHGETDDLAPIPQLYADDRNLRFDALWRLVFAGDDESLEAVREAVPAWPRADRSPGGASVHRGGRPSAARVPRLHDARP